MTPTPLAAAAFGSNPGLWPLPAAATTAELWLRAVAAGGQGRYASARADLAELVRRRPAARLASLALSTQGSFLRQQGGHLPARGWDGIALAGAGPDSAALAGAGPDSAALAGAGPDSEAVVDALVGLAADALGVGRLAAAAALLERADEVHARADDPPPRLAIRLAWVRAELAMAAGDGVAARGFAQFGVELAAKAAPDLRRHQVKSDVVLAAALCSAGDLPGSRRVADAALADSEAAGLVPLRWAVACLLAGIGSAQHSPDEVAEIRDRSATFVARHGGCLRSG